MYHHDHHDYYDDNDQYYDRPQPLARRPWSPIEERPSIGGDGGAISRYLDTIEGRRYARRDAQDTWNFQPDPNHQWANQARSTDALHYPIHESGPRRREASESSIEALDLATYSRTLRQGHRDPYPRLHEDLYAPPQLQHSPYAYSQYQQETLPAPLDDYPGLERPFSALSVQSRSTIQPPPSLVSAGATSHTSHSLPHHAYLPSRRQTMPPTFTPADPAIFSGNSPNQSWRRSRDPELLAFPAWSRNWYDSKSKKAAERTQPPPLETDLATWPPPPPIHHESAPFQPRSLSSAQGDVLPWSSQLGEDSPYVTQSVKEERMRMLEREFGNNSQATERAAEEGAVGTVDPSGSLITAGPRRRATARVAQGACALAAAVSAIYGALGIRPPKPAPPAATGPAYILYILPVFTLLAVLYLFAINPCIQKRKQDKFTDASGPAGMMVLPVVQRLGMGGKKGKKGGYMGSGKGKKGKMQNQDGVQVNLIVDPTMFNRQDPEEPEKHSDDEPWNDGSYYGSSRNRAKDTRKSSKSRLSIFDTITREENWKRARKSLKWIMVFDCAFALLWAAEFGYIIWGKRCPPGQYNGWCDTYNAATACGFLLFLFFSVSIFFDFRDLSASKISPRNRG